MIVMTRMTIAAITATAIIIAGLLNASLNVVLASMGTRRIRIITKSNIKLFR